MTASPLVLTREQILAYRLAANGLTARRPASPASMREAAWAGLTDSMPRAAVLSLHARLEGVGPQAWEDEALVQLWGPRYSAYALPADDRAVFTLGRQPETGPKRALGEDLANRLEAFLDGRRMPFGEAAKGLGLGDGGAANALRYAAPTGRVLIRWDGARQPDIWTAPAPEMDPAEARRELARRHLRVMGAATPASFGEWAGVKPAAAEARFRELRSELVAASTPLGEAWIRAEDEEALRSAGPGGRAAARLLPSGDVFWLLQGRDRELLVADEARRARLWTSRVWPGALLVDGEIAGTWRRADAQLTVEPWWPLSGEERAAVEAEATALPLPLSRPITMRWVDPGPPTG